MPIGGDSSIVTYGRAPAPSEFQAAANAVRAYAWADARADGRVACALVIPGVAGQMASGNGVGAGATRTKKAPSCAAVMTALFRSQPLGYRAKLRLLRVTDARLKDGHGFVIFRMPQTPRSYFPVVRVAGRWRVGAIGGSTLFQ